LALKFNKLVLLFKTCNFMFQDIAHYSKLAILYGDALDVSHVSHCMPAGEALKAEGRRSFRDESLHTCMESTFLLSL
jgi:hypothetical protein